MVKIENFSTGIPMDSNTKLIDIDPIKIVINANNSWEAPIVIPTQIAKSKTN